MAIPSNLPSRIDPVVATDWLAVTPSDTVNLVPGPCFGLYVGGTGDVVAVSANGNAVIFKAVPVGTLLPLRAVRVNSTNTTATLLVALYASG